MMLCREIPEGILYGQHLLLSAEDLLALGSMVDGLVVWLRLRKHSRNTA